MREDTSLCIKETFGVDQSNVYPVFALKSKHVSVMQLIFSFMDFLFFFFKYNHQAKNQ